MKRVTRVIWSELLPQATVFTTSEVADLTDMSTSNASRDLAGLAREGLIVRVKRGLWAVPSHPDFSPFASVPHLFTGSAHGYVSLLSALNLHGMIEQIPRVIQVMCTTQRPRLVTPVGTYEFHQIQPDLFGGYEPYLGTGEFDIATPEKALFDTFYLSARKGRRFSALPEVDLTEGFEPAELEQWILKIRHPPLRKAILDRWARSA
jgi:predicted transcriptional regulator of viral defense system